MKRTWTFAAAAAVLLAGVFAWAQRPVPVAPPFASPLEVGSSLGSSCKTAVPLALQIQPAGTGRWSLELQSLDREHQAVVWMWSASEAKRREVWRGTLRPGPAHFAEVAFAPGSPQVTVWAALEVAGAAGASMRSLASFAPAGRNLQSLSAETGQLLEDPATGEHLLQFQGTPSATAPGEGR